MATIGDATQLRQVVMNLVLNAGEALEGNRGLVSDLNDLARTRWRKLVARSSNQAAAPGLYVCIEVSDTGCGISRKIETRSSTPSSPRRRQDMDSASPRCTALYVLIMAPSLYTAEGRGTSIKVFLPAAKETSENLRRKTPTSSHTILRWSTTKRACATRYRRLLGRAGYQVVTAANGEEALLLTQARGEEFDAFLVDVSMPQMSGPQVCCHSQATPRRCAILMSGYNHVDTVREAFSNGPAGFLQKPFLLDSFTEILEVAFRSAAGLPSH
ncbi:MAG: response regulator [Polyangiaceae bacterium]